MQQGHWTRHTFEGDSPHRGAPCATSLIFCGFSLGAFDPLQLTLLKRTELSWHVPNVFFFFTQKNSTRFLPRCSAQRAALYKGLVVWEVKGMQGETRPEGLSRSLAPGVAASKSEGATTQAGRLRQVLVVFFSVVSCAYKSGPGKKKVHWGHAS